MVDDGLLPLSVGFPALLTASVTATMRGMNTERVVLAVVLVLAAWCCLALATEGAGGDGKANGQPHVVFILADDLGWNDMPWNNREVLAPNLESLARGGVLLNESYVQPLCTPSRSALMSGRYPFTIGRQHSAIMPEEPVGLDLSLTLLPQALKAVGYDTHIVGKWHLGFCSWAYTPTERGFDTFYGYYNAGEDFYEHTRPKMWNYTSGTSWNDLESDFYIDEDIGYLDFRNNTEPESDQTGVYSTYAFASEVETLLDGRDPQVPMFLYLPFQSVHAPLQVPEEYEQLYAHIQDQDRRVYFGMVSAMDEAVGRVVRALNDTGHYDNTLIVFTTDNGGATGLGGNNWPLRGGKSSLWEGGTRGAAFIHSPFLPNPGTSNQELIHITDWLPTLLGLAGGQVPEGIDGVDQWGALTGTAPPARTEMVYNIDNTTEFIAGIRLDNYKLLVGDPGNGNWTLPPEQTEGAPEYDEEAGATNEDKHEDNKLEMKMVKEKKEEEQTEESSKLKKKREKNMEEEENVEQIEEGNKLRKNKMKENQEKEEQAKEEIIRVSDFVGRTRSLLEHLTGRDDTEIRLYDLESDPEERYNVAARHPEVVDTLAQMLEAHLARYTPAVVGDKTPDSFPENFGGVWSPGWC